MRNNEFIESISILAKYIPEDEKDKWGLHAEHDQIWFTDFDNVPEGDDKNRLLELGWFEDEDSWTCYT